MDFGSTRSKSRIADWHSSADLDPTSGVNDANVGNRHRRGSHASWRTLHIRGAVAGMLSFLLICVLLLARICHLARVDGTLADAERRACGARP